MIYVKLNNSRYLTSALSVLWHRIKQALLIALFALPVNAIAADLSPAHEISHISGGIGLDDRKMFLEQSKNYNLQLSFAQQKTGEYVADVQVTIKNMKGKPILEAQSEGPLFYAKLPAGQYTIEAAYNGKMQSKKVSLKAKPKQLYFYWTE